MDHQELLYARHLFHNKEIVVPEKPMHQQTSCPSKEKKGERDDGIQLFAFKSDDSAAKMRCGPERPKRKLKTVRRFDPLSYDSQIHCKIGEGFPCPRCKSICSYDSHECDGCYLECCYEPGVGAVILKNRSGNLQCSRKHNNVAKTEETSDVFDVKSFSKLRNDHWVVNAKREYIDVTDVILAMKKEQQRWVNMEVSNRASDF